MFRFTWSCVWLKRVPFFIFVRSIWFFLICNRKEPAAAADAATAYGAIRCNNEFLVGSIKTARMQLYYTQLILGVVCVCVCVCVWFACTQTQCFIFSTDLDPCAPQSGSRCVHYFGPNIFKISSIHRLQVIFPCLVVRTHTHAAGRAGRMNFPTRAWHQHTPHSIRTSVSTCKPHRKEERKTVDNSDGATFDKCWHGKVARFRTFARWFT